MLDYLPILVPDYAGETLTMNPTGDIQATGQRRQVITETDGDNPKGVTLKQTPDYYIPLSFKWLSESARNILSDLYYNPAKAYGMVKSFRWQHPVSEVVYVARFVSEFNEILRPNGYYEVSLRIKVIGRLS